MFSFTFKEDNSKLKPASDTIKQYVHQGVLLYIDINIIHYVHGHGQTFIIAIFITCLPPLGPSFRLPTYSFQ